MAGGIPSSAADLFDNYAPRIIGYFPEKMKDIGASFLFEVEGEDGGSWLLNFTVSPPTVGRYKADPNGGQPDVKIEISSADFKTLMSNYNAGIDLYFSNALRVTGDPGIAGRLGLLFEVVRPIPGQF